MTLRRFALASKPAVRAGALLSVLGLAGFAIASANTDAVVAKRFAVALETGSWAGGTTDRSHTLVSGSEAYWLAEKRRHLGDGAIEPAAWSAPLAAGLSVGDRITISSGKTERVLEVVTISDVEPAPGAEGAGPHGRQVAVTCRDLSSPDGRLTTFLTSTGGATVAAGPNSAL